MPTNVLLLLPPAAQFAAELRPEIPNVNFIEAPVENASEGFEQLPEADVIITRGHGFDAKCLKQAVRLKWLHSTMAGTDHLVPVLKGSHVALTNGRGSHGVQITEMAILHM